MSYALTATAKRAIFAQETGQIFLTILEISHASLAVPIRVVDNYEDIYSGGYTYQGFPFEISGPNETETLPMAKLSISAIDRQIVDAVRVITGVATVTLSIILAGAPDVIERGPYELKLRNVQWDETVVSGDLMNNDILSEPYPGYSYTPGWFPGLFK